MSHRRIIMKKMIVFVLLVTLLSLVLCACGEENVDYSSAEDFEAALNNGESVDGKVVSFKVDTVNPKGALGHTIWAGEHLNFISDKDPGVKAGDTLKVKVTKATDVLGSWIISYDVVK
jgi:hypothetical protein